MQRGEDRIEIGGDQLTRAYLVRRHAETAAGTAGPRRPFLSIWFRCCHTYGRLYRNRARTRYEGRCPRCGAAVSAGIGPDGSSRRMFEAS